MFKTHKRGRVAAALAVAAGLLLTTATTASAVGPQYPDGSQNGTLTITKLADPGGELTEGDGRQAEQLPSTGLEGVNFQIQKVKGVDLTTENGWVTASNMTVEQAIADMNTYGPAFETSAATDGDGVVSFGGLPLGLYLVTEVAPFPDDIIPTTAPFLVTIPMTDPVALDQWMYEVFVYPKNADTSTTKTVNDTEGYFLGDYVEFDVTMTVPRGATSLVFEDVLDPRLTLTLGNDYFSWITGYVEPDMITQPWSADVGIASIQHRSTPDGSDILTVVFNDPEFLAQHEGQTVGFRIRAKVVGVTGPDGEVTFEPGEITNQAQYFVNTAGGEATGDSNVVVTKWGKIIVHKANQEKLPLEGAEFCLAKSQADALEGVCALEGGALATDGSGTVEFVVRYSDFANNESILDQGQWQSYWLFETKAPEGYELSTEPVEVFVVESEGGIAKVTVTNYPHNAGFDLPLIGGNRAVLPIVAAVIAAGGVVWLIRSRREQQA